MPILDKDDMTKIPPGSSSDTLALVLLFKDFNYHKADSTPDHILKKRLPYYSSNIIYTSTSTTIIEHINVMQDNRNLNRINKPDIPVTLPLFKDDFISAIAPFDISLPTENFCVWGWFRKPWERQDRLLSFLHDQCITGNNIDVYLYNQYLRQIYKAKLLYVHFIEGLDTVELPNSWARFCPDYYKHRDHKCGAYFAISIDYSTETKSSNEDNPHYPYFNNTIKTANYIRPTLITYNHIESNFYLDSISFEYLFKHHPTIISPPQNTIDTCLELADSITSLNKLKATEQTIFLLRDTPLINACINAITNPPNKDDFIFYIDNMNSSSISNLFINHFSRDNWQYLYYNNDIIQLVAHKLNHIIEYDLLLVAYLIGISELFSNEKNSPLTASEKLYIEWLFCDSYTQKRKLATKIFSSVWSHFSTRYHLSSLDSYFNNMDALEEITFSTKYKLDNKFYRDHLNHNVRCSIAAVLLSSYFRPKDRSTLISSFLSGLFHDLAHSLSSYQHTIDTIYNSLHNLNFLKADSIRSIVNKDKLTFYIKFLSIISSMKDLKDNYSQLNDFLEGHSIINIIDNNILFEEFFSALNEDHSLLSAAVIFNSSISNYLESSDNIDSIRYSNAFHQLLNDFEDESRGALIEYLSILQSISLHDRTNSDFYSPNIDSTFLLPQPISLKEFPVATILCICDDLQEWGRPIGDINEQLINNSYININDNNIEAFYEFNVTTIDNSDVNFSNHEFNISKIRNINNLKDNNSNNFLVTIKNNFTRKLYLHNITSRNFRIKFINDLTNKPKHWPTASVYGKDVYTRNNNQLLFVLSNHNGNTPFLFSDIIMIDTDKLGDKNKQLLKDIVNLSVDSIRYTKDQVIYYTNRGIIYCDITNYTVATIDKAGSTFRKKEHANPMVFLLRMDCINIEALDDIYFSKYAKKHITPHPHFIDLDWRFSKNAIDNILSYINVISDEDTVIGYLGCPSLALYHSDRVSKFNDWQLIDRGHYSLDEWVREGLINPKNLIQYDVNDKVPVNLSDKYDIIIMDPPWYEEYYVNFWARALEMLKTKGIIGVAEYPGYVQSKMFTMNAARNDLLQNIGRENHYGSLQISYDTPPFESKLNLDAEFTHEGLEAYRPTYMDFYRLNKKCEVSDKIKVLPNINLRTALSINKNSYLILRNNYKELLKKNKTFILYQKKDLHRITQEDEIVFGMSCYNTIIEVCNSDVRHKGTKINVSNIEDILQKVEEYEKKKNLY